MPRTHAPDALASFIVRNADADTVALVDIVRDDDGGGADPREHDSVRYAVDHREAVTLLEKHGLEKLTLKDARRIFRVQAKREARRHYDPRQSLADGLRNVRAYHYATDADRLEAYLDELRDMADPDPAADFWQDVADAAGIAYATIDRVIALVTPEAQKETGTADPQALADSCAKHFAQWAGGEVYGFLRYDLEPGQDPASVCRCCTVPDDSCWGFVGSDPESIAGEAIANDETLHELS